ncbi:MAG: hypothetical protein KAJ14_14555 [Candidatus Omnitrophica bacterium]|nr:hypothetical protein [Candidatus Omnitrophota bacterium]
MKIHVDKNKIYRILCYIIIQAFIMQNVLLAKVVEGNKQILVDTLSPQAVLDSMTIQQAFTNKIFLDLVGMDEESPIDLAIGRTSEERTKLPEAAEDVIKGSNRAVSDLRGSLKETFSDMLTKETKRMFNEGETNPVKYSVTLADYIKDLLFKAYKIPVELWLEVAGKENIGIELNKDGIKAFGIQIATLRDGRIEAVTVTIEQATQVTERLADYLEARASTQKTPDDLAIIGMTGEAIGRNQGFSPASMIEQAI